MGLMHIEQKKGTPDFYHGKLTVYARIEFDPSDLGDNASHPIASMVHNGLLVAQGNYKEQSSLKDFLISEMGESIEEGLEEFIGKLDGLEGALDPQKLKEKLRNLDEFKDFIPTPAKIVPFHSEEDILAQEGDIYYVGSFKNMANANLSINSFPILYQARYREQEIDMVKREIEQLISQVETNEVSVEHYTRPEIDIEQKIVKDYIPVMLYSKKDSRGYEVALNKFHAFMSGYQFTEDVDRIINIISVSEKLSPLHYKLLELYAKKISEVCKEHFSEVNSIREQISLIEEQLSHHHE